LENQPDLCWDGNGDPDGDQVEYKVVLSKMPVNGDSSNFEYGWLSSDCLSDLSDLAVFLQGLGLDSGTFGWHVVARDPSGALSDSSPCWLTAALDCYGNPWWSYFTLVVGSQPLPQPFAVSSQTGWQQTNLYLHAGETFYISYLSGCWTVDYGQFSCVGPGGYSPGEDAMIFQGCKIDSSLAYGTLLGKVGNGEILSIGNGGTFVATSDGYLYLRINDMDTCLADNSGSIFLSVYSTETTRVTEPPEPKS